MHWFLIALVGPILWSVVNHIDKYLLSKYFRSGGIGGLLIFSSIFGLLVLPVAAFFDPAIFSVSLQTIAVLMFMGAVTAFTLLLYLYALDSDETSIVAPFYQIIPVFGFILGYVVLGETITPQQTFACLILLGGALLLSIELNRSKGGWFKGRLVSIVLLATFLIAALEVAFKFIAIADASFWIPTFWMHVGLVLFGVGLFAIRSYRTQFLRAVQDNRRWVFGLNAGSELLTLVGNIAFSYATLLAPLALVLVVDSYRPLFVFAIGVVLTVFLPHVAKEDLSKKMLAQKIVAIAVMIIGTYLLYT